MRDYWPAFAEDIIRRIEKEVFTLSESEKEKIFEIIIDRLEGWEADI